MEGSSEQDPVVNNGNVINEQVIIPAKDALFLQKRTPSANLIQKNMKKFYVYPNPVTSYSPIWIKDFIGGNQRWNFYLTRASTRNVSGPFQVERDKINLTGLTPGFYIY